MVFGSSNLIFRLLLIALATGCALGNAAIVQSTPTVDADVISAPEVVENSSLPASFEPYLDGVMTAVFEEQMIAGGVISLVYDGQVALAKGYGYADLESRTQVDPAVHLFRPGSVSKLFTWTAVMQLHEQGRVRLDAPISEYVDQFPIPNRFGAITLEHALTHTPGLEDGGAGYLFADSPSDLKPLAEMLARHTPTQQWNPGESPSYSNWTTALAGLVVANVSGVSFEEYISENILEPLGMRNSTFDEPLPAPLAEQMATGYFNQGKGLEVLGFEYIKNFGPAGALSATGEDMTRFMMAHLNQGELDGARILSPESTKLMHSRLFGRIDELPGMAHGFYEVRHNGKRFVAHGGDTVAFHSNLVLDPDGDFGFFMSFNSPIGGGTRETITSAILEYFYPSTEVEDSPPVQGTAERIPALVGTYRVNRRSYTRLESIASFMGSAQIAPGNEERIVLAPSMLGGEFEEVEPFLFEEVNGRETLAFETDDSGRVVRAHLGSLPIMALDKLAWYETEANHLLVIGLALLAALFVMINGVRNWSKNCALSGIAGQATWVLFALSCVNLVFVAGLIVVFAAGMGDFLAILFEFPPPGTGAVLILPILAIVLTVAALIYAPLLWKRGEWNIAKRLRYAYVTVVNVLFLLVLNYWNLIGWQY